MSNYIPHYTKKLAKLQDREDDLKRLIKSGAAAEKLWLAAREVIQARIRALRAEKAQIPPRAESLDRLDSVEAKIRLAETLTEEHVIQEFQDESPDREAS